MNRENPPFLFFFLLTLVLIGLVIFSGHQREMRSQSYEKVDLKRLEKLVKQGKLELHPAQFSQKLESLEEAQ